MHASMHEVGADLRRWIAALAGAGLLLAGAPGALADDPLDETDGTEDWDQVAPAAPPSRPPEEDEFRQEISAWQAISQHWEQERLRYIEERTRHKRIAALPRVLPTAAPQRPVGYQPDADIHDENYNAATGDDGDWGDPPGATLFAPAGSLNRAIDSELEESGVGARPAAEPAPAPAPRAAPAAPPRDAAGEAMPSAFRAHPTERREEGGLTPAASSGASDDWGGPPEPKPDPRAAEAARKREAEARARAEAEARAAAEKARRDEEERQRLQAEEDARRKLAEEEARRNREAEEGAAAAARFLKEQAERERKEQEALRKKAALEEDDEGQVVDPEIKKEMGEEEESPEED